jgi:hypothetical protein
MFEKVASPCSRNYSERRGVMRRKVGLVIVGLVVAGGLGACAKDYGIKDGGSHFASWTHLRFSTRGGDKPALTKEERELAKQEGWWGTPVVYSIDELE